MAADENQHILDVLDPRQQALVCLFACQPVPVNGGQAVVRRVQLLREQEPLGKGLDAVKGDPGQEGDVLE